MDDARRFEDIEADCLRTLHDAARAAGHASRFARFADGAAWAIENEPAIAMAVALGLSGDPLRELDLAEEFFESARVPGRFDVPISIGTPTKQASSPLAVGWVGNRMKVAGAPKRGISLPPSG